MSDYREPPYFHDRIVPSLRVARERLCVAQTDMPHKQHRDELQAALDIIDRLGVFYGPGEWSRFDEPPLAGGETEQ